MTVPRDLESEIRDLAARRDIHDAVCRYLSGLDRLDPALQRSAFHDGAWVDAGIIQGDADTFVREAQSLLAGMEGTQHLLGQIRLAVNGDSASGECYFQAWHGVRDADGHPRDLFIAGRYVDDYACLNGEWRIVRRKLITDWVREERADHSFFAANPQTNRAGRGGEDFSQRRDWPPMALFERTDP